VNCGPWHIQCSYSSEYSGFNIQLNVSALLFEISEQYNAHCTASLVPNTAHILQFALSELWYRPYTKYLLLRIFRLQYSTETTYAAIGYMPTLGCALYCNFGAIYIAHTLQISLCKLRSRDIQCNYSSA
jgi:hypothetical protein